MSDLKNRAIRGAVDILRRDAASGSKSAKTSAISAERIAGKFEIAPGKSYSKITRKKK